MCDSWVTELIVKGEGCESLARSHTLPPLGMGVESRVQSYYYYDFFFFSFLIPLLFCYHLSLLPACIINSDHLSASFVDSRLD